MSGQTLRSILPDIYGRILPTFFDNEAPREEKATCDNCAMCPPAGATVDDEVTYFRPDAKCCTYHPLLPNYLVGAILNDERPDMAEGRRRVQERIAMGMGVTPGWLSPPRKSDMLLRVSRFHGFGRSLTLLCPYFERNNQNCTIWRHRESVCTTFFCKVEKGADSQTFWRSLRKYAVWVENALSGYAADKLIQGHKEPKPLSGDMTLAELEDRPPSEKVRVAQWKEWRGREEEFYRRCSEIVNGLTKEDFGAISAGTEYAERLDGLAAARDAMVFPKLPEALVANPEMTTSVTDKGVLVCTYSRYEPLLLTADLYEVVRAFRADESVAAVRERLLREHGVEVPDELLIGLYQFRVLVPPGFRAEE